MSENSEEVLRLCSRGDIHKLKEYLDRLDKEQIEEIRDESRARLDLIINKI